MCIRDRYIEAGHFGGKGSDCHKAGVVGDTVGDPFKATSGPAINILIKLLSMVSIVFAGLVVLSLIHIFGRGVHPGDRLLAPLGIEESVVVEAQVGVCLLYTSRCV